MTGLYDIFSCSCNVWRVWLTNDTILLREQHHTPRRTLKILPILELNDSALRIWLSSPRYLSSTYNEIPCDSVSIADSCRLVLWNYKKH